MKELKAKRSYSGTSATSSLPPTHLPGTSLKPYWQHLFGEARTRILLWYVLIFALVFLAGIPAFRYWLFQRVDERVRQGMAEEMETFYSLINRDYKFLQSLDDSDSENLERLKENLKTTHADIIPPNSKEDLTEFFRQYLLYRIPKDDTFLITFVDGKFYKSSPRARPEALSKDGDLVQQWKDQTRPSQGEVEVSDPSVSKILYMVEPVQINGQTRGVFVVAHATAGERAEILEALLVVVQVFVVLFLIALLLTWFAAGRVLAPLRTITSTAQTISETDLSRRLPVRGRGELAELAATFNGMMNRLEIAFDTQREFINDAGHELRTPITIIRGHLELMGNDPAEQQETLALVVSELERMSRLVDDMILLAKAERADFLHLETVDVAELTQELFTKAKALEDRDWQLDNSARGRIVVDRERITEAIMNLAQNATQHTQPEDTIAIGSAIAKGKVRFWVRDTGEGIPLPDQKRIFERFARAANSRRRSEGAGLGLSIVKAIAEAHSGQVLLRSKLGSGSMFTIVLPLDPPQEMVAHVAYPHRRR
ncbi:sensor histidine kinase [Leptothermofonsia sp. ETS-13]|uniref:sensor histidine kinase n=1 Tax=Leptothermofonsia sp. ETS-13 TaxID=3035696 RepID=UPI003B9FE277